MLLATAEEQDGIGLALSGGGARGLAHIGVLKVLEREHIRVASIAGTSMGGVIAALYAAGWDAVSLEREALQMTAVRELMRLVDFRPPRRGLLAGQNVREYLAGFIDPQLTFDGLKIPTALKAVDINTGQQVDLISGNLLDAVLATSAFPGVFPHVEIDGRSLVDGGVLNNLPLDLIDQMGTDKVLAVDVSPRYPGADADGAPPMIGRLPTMAQDVYRTVMLMLHDITEAHIEKYPPDLLLTPDIPCKIGTFSGFTRADEIIRAGETAAEQHVAELIGLVRTAA